MDLSDYEDFFVFVKVKMQFNLSGSNGSGGGNTKTPPKLEKNIQKRENSSKNWAFTYNNYPENWLALVAPGFEGSAWIAGEEVGENGTLHIQGYVEFPIKVRPIGYKGLPKEIHWEKARGTKAENITYCTKESGGKHGTIKVPRVVPKVELYGWQLKAKEQIESKPDNRSIFWWWSEMGGMGKSSFVRWAVMEKNALICSGKASDMKYLVVKYHEKHGDWPEVVIFDVPRSSMQYLSYTGIEEIKNGVFASTKYECDTVVMPHPHVFVLANFEPDYAKGEMSNDRWRVNIAE